MLQSRRDGQDGTTVLPFVEHLQLAGRPGVHILHFVRHENQRPVAPSWQVLGGAKHVEELQRGPVGIHCDAAGNDTGDGAAEAAYLVV